MQVGPHSGTLYVVATPIGNLSDMTPRAIEVLTRASVVLCEDTRHSGKLLEHFGISTPLVSYHEHNELVRAEEFAERIAQGISVALISDAGTPGISDPGYRIVRCCRKAGITVCSVPGPCAATAALAASGLPTDRFVFEGFLPQKPGKRRRMLLTAIENQTTTVFYESPFRIVKTLTDILELAPGCEVFCARELTKKFEECWHGTPADILAKLQQKGSIKGEFVLIINSRQM